MVEGNIIDKNIIEERAQYVGIPLTGKFCLFQIVPNNAPNISIGKMLIEFSEYFPRFKFIRYQQRIVAVHYFYAKNIEEQLENITGTLETFLEKIRRYVRRKSVFHKPAGNAVFIQSVFTRA